MITAWKQFDCLLPWLKQGLVVAGCVIAQVPWVLSAQTKTAEPTAQVTRYPLEAMLNRSRNASVAQESAANAKFQEAGPDAQPSERLSNLQQQVRQMEQASPSPSLNDPGSPAQYSSPAHRSATRQTEDLPAINQTQKDQTANRFAELPATTDDFTAQLPGSQNAVAAAQPKLGDHFHDQQPCVDSSAALIPYDANDFSPDSVPGCDLHDPSLEMDVYQGKYLNRTQRPLVELGRPFYDFGPFQPSSTLLGETNLMAPQFLIYGDWRNAVATNRVNGDELTQIATRLNLDLDLKLTSTERFHAFVRPFDRNGQFTRLEIDSGNYNYFPEFDFEFDTGFFEGDLGAITGGMTDSVLPFDLPFAVGQIPLFLQNGIWMDDAFLGAAATIPARNSPRLDWPNFDTTFFWGFSNITSPVFQGEDDAAKMYGTTSFIEAYDGYIEMGYVYLEDRRQLNRSYHNIGLSYTRRYGGWLSNSVRVIANAGQDPNGFGANADGAVLLVENSLITRKPYSVVPYFNMFAGFGRPQSVARAAGTGGILRNTGINFETDGLTNYPTLDASANESWGGALGINLLGDKLTHQLVLEFAFLQTMNDDSLRVAAGDQYAVGTRYQLPLSNSVLLRADTIYGFLEEDDNIFGSRLELRKKF
jgi:hypothetical protein